MKPKSWTIIVLLISILNIVKCQNDTHIIHREKRFISRLLGVPNQCNYNGVSHECTLTLSCWMGGGKAVKNCGNNWFYSCCVKRSLNVKHAAARKPEAEEYYDFALRTNVIKASVRNEYNCGIQETTLQKRIIGGNDAFFGEFPWLAHIRISDYQCGGVLLNHDYVATAAHCVYKANLRDIIVHLGEYDTKNTGFYPEPIPKEIRRVVKRVIHPNFHYMSIQPDRFDVALLQLDYPVDYRPNIIPVCLPPEGRRYEGFIGVVAGWGKTDTSFGKTGTNLLQKVEVPVLRNEDCKSWHRRKNIKLALFDEMICAGYSDGNRDACLGDSGGPLIVFDRGRWTLGGITSAGFGCAVDHQPGIYHRISATSGWISAVINS